MSLQNVDDNERNLKSSNDLRTETTYHTMGEEKSAIEAT